MLKISQSLAQKHMAVPIDIENGKLKVAMVDPTNIIALDDIMLYTNMRIIAVLSSEKQLMKYVSDTVAIRGFDWFAKYYCCWSSCNASMGNN